MKIIQATTKDVNQIMEIIEHARTIMRANGNTTQWTNRYPSKEIILSDIECNHGFVCLENEEITGYFCFFKGNDPEPNYQVIENGNWLNDKPYGVIHRLASNGKAKGVAKACFDYCFKQIQNIKVDTNHDNIPMQNFFKKYGFTYCGVIYVNDGTPRDAFQMMILD